VLAYQYAGGALNFQVAPFVRYSQTRFTPDPQGGDLIFSGVADRSRLSSLATGVQADGSYKLSDAHTLRFGLFFQNERTRSLVTSRVFPVDGAGNQTSDVPITITDKGGRNGQLYGVYLQDEWSLSPTLTLNYGVRFDAVRAYTREQQVSPRANLVWKPGGGTTLHLGYARNFTPPPQELIAAPTLALFTGTTKQPQNMTAGPVRAEREHYFDGGVEQVIAPGFKVGLSWQGSTTFVHDKGRSIPLGAFEPLAGISDIRLISLQKRPGAVRVGGADLGRQRRRRSRIWPPPRLPQRVLRPAHPRSAQL